MTDFLMTEHFNFTLTASGHKHKIVLSVNKLYMGRLYFQGDRVALFPCSIFICFFWMNMTFTNVQHKVFKISNKKFHINSSMIFAYFILFKVGLSPSKKSCVICFIESPIKIMKKHFLFHLKSSFCSQDI